MPEPGPLPSRTLVVRAPARADLAGGTLDLWPLYCFHRPAVTVNVALRVGVVIEVTGAAVPSGSIRLSTPNGDSRLLTREDVPRDLVATVGFHFAPEGGLEVVVLAQPPFGSGLGGSSVMAVALARACLGLVGRRLPGGRLVAVLRDLEAAVLGAPTGVQDYWPALTGGVTAIHLGPGGERIEPLGVPAKWVAERLLVIHSGITHHSGMVNWEVYRARVDGDRQVSAALDRIAAAAAACRAALLAADEGAVGRAIDADWSARRSLAPSVTSPEVDDLVAAGLSAGAFAAKACGAGGGGSVLFWIPPGRRAAVERAACAACPNASALPAGVRRRGALLRRPG